MMRSRLFGALGVVAIVAAACSSGGGTPSPGRIGTRRHALVGPGGADSVDPGPLRFDLVAADEQSRIALDQVEQ